MIRILTLLAHLLHCPVADLQPRRAPTVVRAPAPLEEPCEPDDDDECEQD